MEDQSNELENRFTQFRRQQTANGFHDAILLKIEVNFDLREITLEIEHWKDGSKPQWEDVFVGTLTFKEVEDLYLDNNDYSQFGVNDGITEFSVQVLRGKTIFRIVGSEGWVFSFAATDFEYKEVLQSRFKYIRGEGYTKRK